MLRVDNPHITKISVPRLLVFDLDGTLIDSRLDLCNAVNATLFDFSLDALPASIISTFIGNGVTALVERSFRKSALLNYDEKCLPSAVRFFLNHYGTHKLDFTYVYQGVRESLVALSLRQPELLMAILTNKPVSPSLEICKHFGLNRFFFQNYGGDSFAKKKPDPMGLSRLIVEAEEHFEQVYGACPPLKAQETVMIGDTDVDVLTARALGAHSIGCSFGFAPESLEQVRPDGLAQSPADWPRLIDLIYSR